MATYIKVVTFIENFIGQKIYQTHCIPLDNQAQMTRGMSDLITYIEQHIPSFLSVEIVNVEPRQIKPKK